MKSRFVEVATTGIDEGLQNVSSDPIGSSFPVASGLRVPPVLSAASIPNNQPRYLFCLATRKLTKKTRLIGMRQGLTLGLDMRAGTPPQRVVETRVTTPNFHFEDGNVSWHLVQESVGRRVTKQPLTDTASWSYMESDGAAMLYKTFTNTNVDAFTGAPIYYDVGLTAYTDPPIYNSWEDICGCSNMHDIRYPWDSRAWKSFGDGIEIEGTNSRVSLYASVLQTNPLTRTALVLPTTFAVGSSIPEEVFIQNMVVGGVQATTFWRIFGALIFEDEI